MRLLLADAPGDGAAGAEQGGGGDTARTATLLKHPAQVKGGYDYGAVYWYTLFLAILVFVFAYTGIPFSVLYLCFVFACPQ